MYYSDHTEYKSAEKFFPIKPYDVSTLEQNEPNSLKFPKKNENKILSKEYSSCWQILFKCGCIIQGTSKFEQNESNASNIPWKNN